jgi:hypothetical protein
VGRLTSIRVDADEYEWLVLSEKMFRMIALVHDQVQDFINRPIWFYAQPDPVNKCVKFKVRYRQITFEYRHFKFTLPIDDYSPDEILAEITLAYHAAQVWRP